MEAFESFGIKEEIKWKPGMVLKRQIWRGDR